MVTDTLKLLGIINQNVAYTLWKEMEAQPTEDWFYHKFYEKLFPKKLKIKESQNTEYLRLHRKKMKRNSHNRYEIIFIPQQILKYKIKMLAFISLSSL